MADLLTAAQPAADASAGIDSAALDRLRDGISGDIERGRHTGAVVLVARAGEIALHEAFGESDPRTQRAALTSDRFATASLGKAFTAALVLKMIDRGALSFDTRVSSVIPEYAVRGKDATTIRHLLCHTGGAYAGFLPPPPLTWPDLFELSRYVAGVAAQPALFEPGTQVSYTPFASYAVLGEIVQRLGGQPFNELIATEILRPLGMDSTSFGLPTGHPERVPQRMVDHNPGAAGTDIMESFDQLLTESVALPAGGSFATAADVFRFAEFQRRLGTLESERILSPALTRYALAIATGERPNMFWDFSRSDRGIAPFPANLTLFGGYARGEGHYMTPLGFTSSPGSFGAVGSGSTMYLVDPERELTFVFLGAGMTEGLGHFEDMCRLCDLAVSACD